MNALIMHYGYLIDRKCYRCESYTGGCFKPRAHDSFAHPCIRTGAGVFMCCPIHVHSCTCLWHVSPPLQTPRNTHTALKPGPWISYVWKHAAEVAALHVKPELVVIHRRFQL